MHFGNGGTTITGKTVDLYCPLVQVDINQGTIMNEKLPLKQDLEMVTEGERKVSLTTKILAAIGNFLACGAIGLLLGLLVGMSAIPVVANLIGVLTTAALAYVGFRSSAQNNVEPIDKNSTMGGMPVRITGFAILCIVGLLTGVFVRTHDLLGRPVSEQFQSWTGIGFTDVQARDIVLFKETGISPDDKWKNVSADSSRSAHSLLYGASTKFWSETDPKHFKNADETMRAWTTYGGVWKLLVPMVQRDVVVDKQYETLQELHDILKERQ